MIKPGEEELTHIFCLTNSQLGTLSTFYSVMSHGLPHGAKETVLDMAEFGDMLYEDGTLASFLYEPEKVDIVYQEMEKQFGKVHQNIKDNAKKSLDAVAIILAHSILDVSVYGYLEVLSLASPEYFINYIERKQISMSEVKSKEYDQLRDEKIKEYMTKQVERNSLMFKLDKFHEIVQPTNTRMNPEYKYDRQKLEQFDKTRHEIVHENKWTSFPINFTKEFFYWNLLNWYMLREVIKKTGLKLIREKLFLKQMT
ncbi:MAG: hypothetical protein JW715_07380 [Sedimentisphaerales bacterium]|nr:hypothetical protein [Sedimentisphaerales bacterium]